MLIMLILGQPISPSRALVYQTYSLSQDRMSLHFLGSWNLNYTTMGEKGELALVNYWPLRLKPRKLRLVWDNKSYCPVSECAQIASILIRSICYDVLTVHFS